MVMRRDSRPFTFGPNVTRAALRQAKRSRHVIEPAHPRIADALCAVGTWIADNVEPLLVPWRRVIRAAAWLAVIVGAAGVFLLGMFGGLPQ